MKSCFKVDSPWKQAVFQFKAIPNCLQVAHSEPKQVLKNQEGVNRRKYSILRTQVGINCCLKCSVADCQWIFTNSSYNPGIFHLFVFGYFMLKQHVWPLQHNSCLVFNSFYQEIQLENSYHLAERQTEKHIFVSKTLMIGRIALISPWQCVINPLGHVLIF